MWPVLTGRRWRRMPTVIRSSGGKSIHTRISRIAEQLEEIWQYAESVTKQELRDSPHVTYQDITPEKMERALEQKHETLKETDTNQKMKAKIQRVRKAWPEQLKKYESQGKILDGRNSYSQDRPQCHML